MDNAYNMPKEILYTKREKRILLHVILIFVSLQNIHLQDGNL
jgi:hypothetical protein